MAIYGPRGPGFAHTEYKPYHIQDLQYWLDKVNEAIMAMETNVDVLSALQQFYLGLPAKNGLPAALKDEIEDDVAAFAAQVHDLINDFKMQLSRARLLASVTRDRKELVRAE